MQIKGSEGKLHNIFTLFCKNASLSSSFILSLNQACKPGGPMTDNIAWLCNY